MSTKFQIGDLVRLSSIGKDCYEDSDSNPHNLTVEVVGFDGFYRVSWPKDRNVYAEEALELVEVQAVGDNVNHPPHYKSHPSGVECIEITEHMNFCLGNALKYIWRADEKHSDGGLEDLKKAAWYIQRELDRRSNAARND